MRLRPWMLVSAAWILPAILAVVNEIAQRRLSGEAPASVPQLLFAGGDWLLYALLTPMVFVLSKRWPLARPFLARHAAVHLAMSLLFCAVWAGAGTILREALTPRALCYPAAVFVSWLFITFPFGVAVYLSVVGTEHAIRHFADARDRELQLSMARFGALQAQVNPHFLFNTLNTIAVLVRDGDRQGAVRIVEELSDVLRLTLTRHRTNEVSLADELDLVRQYLAIETVRFSDRLQSVIDVDAALLTSAVPGFAVQHLVENAIRHGTARRTDAGHVGVSARRVGDVLQVTVTDDGPGIDEGRENTAGHGIANTRERLRALYGERASLTIARGTVGTIATLRVPYRVVQSEPSSDAT